MAKTTININGKQTDIINKLHTALLDVGLVQTSDTGQINPATVNRTSGVGFTYGYTIYRFNDAAQSAFPVFIRVDWRNSSNNQNLNYVVVYPVITVGSGTDGAGTITGSTTFQTNVNSLAIDNQLSTPLTTYSSFVSFVDGCLTLALYVSAAGNYPMFISIDRLRLLDGQPTGGATSVTFYGPTTRAEKFYSDIKTTVKSTSTFELYFPYSWWVESPNTALGTDYPFVSLYKTDPRGLTQIGPVGIPSAEVSYDTDFTVARFGVNRTYKSMGTKFTAVQVGGDTASSALGIAMPWE